MNSKKKNKKTTHLHPQPKYEPTLFMMHVNISDGILSLLSIIRRACVSTHADPRFHGELIAAVILHQDCE